MPLKSLIGLDHVVVVARDLDAAAQRWAALGFTVSPRGVHSAHMGTGNHTLMLGADYIELLGVLTPTEQNAPTRALLAQREGIERAAFTTSDAAAGVADLRSRGIAGIGPTDFSRPVGRADGTRTEARFQTFQWPRDQRPGGLRIFACQHFTRDAVWLPELLRHDNTALGIAHIEMLTRDPKRAADFLSALTGLVAVAEAGGGWRVESGAGRGAFVFVDEATLAKRHPGVPLAGLPDEGCVALTLRVADVDAAARCAGPSAIRGPGRVTVPPALANGVILEMFE